MKTDLLLCAALCATITLSACGDDPVPASNNASPDMNTPDMNTSDMNNPDMNAPDMNMSGELTADNFSTELAEVICAKAKSCCTPEEYMTRFEGDDCVAETGGLYAQTFPTSEDVASGRITFDATAAQGTIDMLNMTSCTGLDLVRDIALPFTGNVEVGQPCDTSTECAAPAGKGVFCSVTCQVLKGSGEACTDSFDCDVDLYCDTAGTCAPTLPGGGACVEDLDCKSARCSEDNSTCNDQVELGQSCAQDDECLSGFCDFNTSVCVATYSGVPFCGIQF
jgi:hypothetical protein